MQIAKDGKQALSNLTNATAIQLLQTPNDPPPLYSFIRNRDYDPYRDQASRMSDTRPHSDQFHSRLFKESGVAFTPAALQELDHKVYNYEVDKESKIEEQKKQIKNLQGELDSAKEKLKRLQESRFKSKEREMAVADSTLAEKYDTLIGDIKSTVLNLTRSVDGKIKDVLTLMKGSTRYQEGLQRLLSPNIPVSQFIELLEQSSSPAKLLVIVLRAVILDMLRLRLFNSNVFLCTGGENWKQLQDVYHQLLSTGNDSQRDSFEIQVTPGNDIVRKDASLWRSQTLATLERNKDRLALKEGQTKLLQGVASDIEALLEPLVASKSQSRETLRDDIRHLIEFATDLSIKFGRQRAMFELEPKRYIGHTFQRAVMEAVGPWAFETDDGEEQQPNSDKPAEILLVVVPALFKFGNDDGEEFDHFRVVRQAQVLTVPTKAAEEPNRDHNSSSPDGHMEVSSTATSKATNKAATTSGNDSNAPKSVPTEPSQNKQEQSQPKTVDDKKEDKLLPPLPAADEGKSDMLTKQCASEQKAIKSEVSIDAKKQVRPDRQPSTGARKSHHSHSRKSKTSEKK
ncbi:hypothetical protein Dda_9137 [Drechslerella dactyloides]|uniref:Uncharacterized protein n=1 Tax=Drechslerella dactyloides TaxID=74499 RepID=A0AAD6NF95_DREDA|nr:hypothetical protein Dda_9137 [Drechslerella dactyloides]